jgi:hypothetical protein
MRDLDTVDSEPRLLAAVRRSIREHGGEPSSFQVDELLDERLLLARRISAITTAVLLRVVVVASVALTIWLVQRGGRNR